MKKLMMAAVVGLGMLAARAELADRYFYWQVMAAESEFSYAKLAYTVADGEKGYFTIGDTAAKAVASAEDGLTTESVFANLGKSDWAGYGFSVETYDDSGVMVGISDLLGYVAIADYVFDYQQMMERGVAGLTPLGIAVRDVPEPTGGLLLLFGLAGLALRRKRA